MAHWAKIQPVVKQLCEQENGASLKEISIGIDRPFNVCSKFISNLLKSGEIVKAGVHGKFRYFTDKNKASEHHAEAVKEREKQKEETFKRRRQLHAERERKKAAKMREAISKSQEKPVKPAKEPKRQPYVNAEAKYRETKKYHRQANIIWPEGVQVQKIPHSEDYRFKFTPEPGWRGQITQDWYNRRLAA